MGDAEIINMLSIDVEDYFHVSAFEHISPPASWSDFERRVERNTEKILDLLSAEHVKATFFVLGWVARFSPGLVRKISAQGHEIASHGYGHQRLVNMSRDEFREDIRHSKSLLEDLSGCAVNGYRAPSYSISLNSLWAFDELVDAGYTYDSSVFPIQHDFYGIPDWPRFMFSLCKSEGGEWSPGINQDSCSEIMEVPISTLCKGGRNLPIAGGGYFRLYPYAMTRKGLREINVHDRNPFVFYIHPWEFDPGQPRMKNAGLKSNFRHYLNLGKTEARFSKLIRDFRFATIEAVLQGETVMPPREQFVDQSIKSTSLH